MAALNSKLDLSTSTSDLPPESFWVPTTDEQDWFNHNAVMQRKTSLKLGFNRNYTSFSHRSDVVVSNPKPSRSSVFGLPNVQKTGPPDPDKKPARFLFRSRSEPGGRPEVHTSEPGSPRVSCTGRVRFKGGGGEGKKTGFSRLLVPCFRLNWEKAGPGKDETLDRFGDGGSSRVCGHNCGGGDEV